MPAISGLLDIGFVVANVIKNSDVVGQMVGEIEFLSFCFVIEESFISCRHALQILDRGSTCPIPHVQNTTYVHPALNRVNDLSTLHTVQTY